MEGEAVRSLWAQADEAFRAGSLERSVAFCDEVLQSGASWAAPETLMKKARALATAGRVEKAVVLWRAVYDPSLREAAGPLLQLQARFAVADSAVKRNEMQDAIAWVDPLVELLADDTDPGTRRLAAEAAKWLLHVLTSHRDPHATAEMLAERNERALVLAKAVMNELGGDEDPGLTRFAVSATLSRMIAAVNVGDADLAEAMLETLVNGGEQAIDVLSEWESNLSRNPERFAWQIVIALTALAEALARIDRLNEALEALDLASERFSGNADPRVRAALAQAAKVQDQLQG